MEKPKRDGKSAGGLAKLSLTLAKYNWWTQSQAWFGIGLCSKDHAW